jgi:NADH:ubiquinone reductase (H+-translocating)
MKLLQCSIITHMQSTKIPRIVIIGCGFGGLEAAKALKNAAVSITLIDRSNHHLFQPLLYQVATAGLAAPAIAAPIRSLFRKQSNLTTLLADVTGIDAAAQTVAMQASNGTRISLAYDYLVVATGATHSYFGNDAWAQYAPGLKTLADAQELRRRILFAFEAAESEADPALRQALLTFVVIGAGPTGVEMAGTMAEIARHTLPGEFRHIDPAAARVLLVEGGERVLQAMPADLSAKAQLQLAKLGVQVQLGRKVTSIDADGVVANGARIASKTVVWAAGVAASPLGKLLAHSTGCALDRSGRVLVQSDLRIAGSSNIWVIGDLAAATSMHGGVAKPVPGVSPAAKQMGRCAAGNVLRAIKGQGAKDFHYQDYGNLATIGRNAAVVDLASPLGHFKFSGYPAWLFWLFAHIYFLIGFRNRFVVLVDWASAYWSFSRHARIVAGGATPSSSV